MDDMWISQYNRAKKTTETLKSIEPTEKAPKIQCHQWISVFSVV